MTSQSLNEADVGVSAGGPSVKDVGSAHEKVRERAHRIWVDEGRPHGRDVEHWLRAKWEVESEPAAEGDRQT
jgi:Protein of unknown function (DUF2934)